MNRERLTYDFLANSDLSVARAILWPPGRRTILWVCSVFGANKWLRPWLLALMAWNKLKSLSLSKSTAVTSLLTICHLLAFPRIFWMLSMWSSDAISYHAGDAYRMRDNIIAWNTFNNCTCCKPCFLMWFNKYSLWLQMCVMYSICLPAPISICNQTPSNLATSTLSIPSNSFRIDNSWDLVYEIRSPSSSPGLQLIYYLKTTSLCD